MQCSGKKMPGVHLRLVVTTLARKHMILVLQYSNRSLSAKAVKAITSTQRVHIKRYSTVEKFLWLFYQWYVFF